MAALSSSRNYTVVTFSDISVVLNLSGDQSEHLLKHESSCTIEETENNDANIPVICSSFSQNGDYFTCCIYKSLYLWDTKNWNLLSKREAHRSASAVQFSPKGDDIVIADKSGDVFLFSVESPEKQGELILGHISMLLDILITPNNKYVITSDRDEKIRVSCFPNSYNIQSFCLGHEDFVTCLNILPHNETVLVSGSGDGTLRFWDYESGKQLVSYFCNESDKELDENSKPVITKIESLKYDERASVLCAQLISLKGILVYCINSNSSNELKCTFKQTISMDSEPLSLSLNGTFLWILKENIEDCLLAYNFCNDKNEFVLVNSLTSFKNILKKHTALLEDVFKKERHVNTLYKRRFDNVQEYLKRKMIRIETDAKKSKNDLPISDIT